MHADGGIVRAARRPAGWQAPGPPPATNPDAALGPRPGEDLCYLAGDWRIFQQIAGHRWSLDDLVTAWVAAETMRARPPARFADLGCGIGTVLMLTAWSFPTALGVGIEAQSASVDLARRSLAWDGADTRCEVRHGDFRDLDLVPERGGFDLVTGTPPYLTPGHATASRRAQCGPCHFEERGGVEDYCAAAACLLAPGGWFVMCAAAFQHARVVAGAARADLTIAHTLTVVPRAGKPPLFAVYALRGRGAPGARPGLFAALAERDAAAPTERDVAAPTERDAALTVRDRAGQWTPAFRRLRTAMGLPARG